MGVIFRMYLVDHLHELAVKLAECAELARSIDRAPYTDGLDELSNTLDEVSVSSDELSITVQHETERMTP